MTNKAITIGVQKYQFFSPLKYAANDAEKMRNFLLEEAGFDEVLYYSDYSPEINGDYTRPTRSNLEFLLENQFKEPFMGIGDNFWFFLVVMVVERMVLIISFLLMVIKMFKKVEFLLIILFNNFKNVEPIM